MDFQIFNNNKVMATNLVRYILIIALTSTTLASYAQSAKLQPASIPGAEARTYKTIDDVSLSLHIFQPSQHADGALRPAIVFFFGGGWKSGTVDQFVPHSKYFAERGMVAIVVDYRVKSRHGVTPFECVADAKSAIRWVRDHASEYGINPKRIVAAGGSAGGHLAATTALLKGFDEANEDLKVSARPDALVLFNPALDMLELRKHFEADDEGAKQISPMHQIGKGAPPTIIFHGTGDETVPFTQATRFCDVMTQQGSRCEVVPFEGRAHGFFNHGRGDGSDYRATVEKTDGFLVSLGYIMKEEVEK